MARSSNVKLTKLHISGTSQQNSTDEIPRILLEKNTPIDRLWVPYTLRSVPFEFLAVEKARAEDPICSRDIAGLALPSSRYT